jgi:hypothetical protein
MKKALIIFGLVLICSPAAFCQWQVVTNIVTWPGGLNPNTNSNYSALFEFTSANGSARFPNVDALVGAAENYNFQFTQVAEYGQNNLPCTTGGVGTVCFVAFQWLGAPPLPASGVTSGPDAPFNIIFYPPQITINPNGKYVFFETQTSPNAEPGGRCYVASENSCVYGWIDLTLSNTPESGESNCGPSGVGCIIAWSNPLTGVPPNQGGTGSYLELDNSVCSQGGQISSSYYFGVVYGTNINWTVTENPSGGDLGFGGTLSDASWQAYNFDGSLSPFTGPVVQIAGNMSGSTGNCTDDGVGFLAYQFPSLGSADISLTFNNAGSSLSQVQSITMTLQENDDFTVSATGKVTGPAPCFPLTFTVGADDGIALGNLYALNASFLDSQNNQGSMSIGLFLVSPFSVSGVQLAQYGYTTSGNESGIPVQVWDYDTTATPLCAADPAIGQGVVIPRSRRPRQPVPIRHGGPIQHEFDREKFLKEFWQKYENARIHN